MSWWDLECEAESWGVKMVPSRVYVPRKGVGALLMGAVPKGGPEVWAECLRAGVPPVGGALAAQDPKPMTPCLHSSFLLVVGPIVFSVLAFLLP